MKALDTMLATASAVLQQRGFRKEAADFIVNTRFQKLAAQPVQDESRMQRKQAAYAHLRSRVPALG